MTREMKNSGIEWVGEIPADWKVEKNKHCFELTKNIVGEDFENYKLLSLTKKGIIVKDTNNSFGKVPESYETYQSVKQGQIVLCLFDLDCSAVFSGLSNYDGMISPAYKVYDCKECIDKKYAEYWFDYCFDGRKYMIYSKSLRYVVNADDFGTIEIILPPLTEQKKIADFLDSKVSEIDKMIAETKSSIENYKEYKQSIITEAVTKGLNKDVQMKDSGIEWIGQIPADWEVVKIKYVSKVSRGLFNHRPRNDERYYNGAYPFIQTGDVASADKYITKYSQTLNELGKSVSKEFPKGTLTMTIAANIGDVSILGFDSYFPDSIIGFVPNDNIQNIYLYYIFKAMKEQFINASVMNTQLNLNIERVREIFIPITYNQDKQQEIIDYLDKQCTEIDNLISEKEALIVNLEEYKKSLIYEYVTGKKAVL